MTARTHTGLTKWDKITMWSIGAFVGGMLLNTVARFADDVEWLVVVGALATLVIFAGLILGIIGAVKVWGGLRTGLTLLVGGVVLFVLGWGMLNSVEMKPFLLSEIPDFNDPLYIIGTPLRSYGLIFLVTGAIMAAVTYLRRVLRAVEGRGHAHRVAPYMDDK